MALLLLVAAIVCFVGAAFFSAPAAVVVPLGLAFVAAALAFGPAEKFIRSR